MKVWKYEIPIQDTFDLLLPVDSEILSFATQREIPCIWVLVKDEKPLIERHFRFCGTGHPITENRDNLKFIGSTLMFNDSLVWHLFEIIRMGTEQ